MQGDIPGCGEKKYADEDSFRVDVIIYFMFEYEKQLLSTINKVYEEGAAR